MRWRAVLEGVSWVVAVPAVLLAVSHPDVGELGVGAFGPPAAVTLGRWLLASAVLAGASAYATRRMRMGVLAAGAVLSFGNVQYQHRAFTTRDVTFPGLGISIAATVYEPRQSGPHPAVVLVHGSAPLRRGFYSLWAERLARDGMVVIVPDKRGVGDTGGMFERNNNSSVANLELLATDAASALDFAVTVPSVDTTRLGLFGLSQAGWIAPMAAVRSNRARFLVLITSPTVSVREEGAWSSMRGDDQGAALQSAEAAERIMDTVRVGGVDARSRLGALTIPGLWLFGADDNSIPTRKSVAVLDSLRGLGKRFSAVTFPRAGHLLMTRDGSLLPHVVGGLWDSIDRWLQPTLGRP